MIITALDFYTKNWTKTKIKDMEKAIVAGIERGGITLAWYKMISPLRLYLHDAPFRCNNAETDISKITFSSWKTDEVFLTTSKDFYPCYYMGNIKVCKAYLFEDKDSNLDIWKISVEGNDDYSLAFDIIGRAAAYAEWERVTTAKDVTDELLEGYYFNN